MPGSRRGFGEPPQLREHCSLSACVVHRRTITGRNNLERENRHRPSSPVSSVCRDAALSPSATTGAWVAQAWKGRLRTEYFDRVCARRRVQFWDERRPRGVLWRSRPVGGVGSRVVSRGRRLIDKTLAIGKFQKKKKLNASLQLSVHIPRATARLRPDLLGFLF
jgi:hypothetical protein